jgi:uncharacterized membrane protein
MAEKQAPLDRAVRAHAELRAEQLQELPRSQLGIERFTNRIGRPWFAYAVLAFIAIWIGLDLTLAKHARFDTPAFSILQLIVGVLSLLMATFILITENRQGVIAEKRAQLTLHLSLANEERAAKIISLLEELRRDDPVLPDRPDEVAEQMAEATDLRTAIDKMEDADASLTDRDA